MDVLAAECRLRFRSIAPGSRPASSRTWNPLQMPSTGPPAAANACDLLHDGREPRDRTGAQVVAVREPAGQNDGVGALEARCPCARSARRPDRARAWRRDRRRDRSSIPGKTTTANFMTVDLDAIALDDRIGEQLVGGLRRQRARLVSASARRFRARSTCLAARPSPPP